MTNSKQVAEGSRFVQETGEALGRIVAGIGSVHKSVVDISTATDEQVNGIREVSTSTNNIDRITQRNALQAVKGAENAQALTNRARALNELAGAMRKGDPVPVAKSA